jgi:hypothetical protein
MNLSTIASTGKIGIGVLALLASGSQVYAQRPQDSQRGDFAPGNQPAFQNNAMPRGVSVARAPEERAPVAVDRVEHGSIRHVDEQVVPQRPVEVRREVVEPRHEVVEAHREIEVRPRVAFRHDVEVDVAHARFWHDFAFGRRLRALREGCRRVFVNGALFFYDSGIYYQQAGDDYQEVYPPVGAVIPDLPDGAIAIEAGNLVYYYVAGAFYAQQNGGFVIAPTPMGVTVPELPPGAVSVSVNGSIAYQFNGIYYQPVFVNGVTQYMTFLP